MEELKIKINDANKIIEYYYSQKLIKWNFKKYYTDMLEFSTDTNHLIRIINKINFKPLSLDNTLKKFAKGL